MPSKPSKYTAQENTRELRAKHWYSPGAAHTFRIDKTEIVIRFVGRKGRRARIELYAKQDQG